MSVLLQQILIGIVVAAAVGYLVWHYVRSKKSRPCASCRLMQIAEKKQTTERRQPVNR